MSQTHILFNLFSGLSALQSKKPTIVLAFCTAVSGLVKPNPVIYTRYLQRSAVSLLYHE